MILTLPCTDAVILKNQGKLVAMEKQAPPPYLHSVHVAEQDGEVVDELHLILALVSDKHTAVVVAVVRLSGFGAVALVIVLGGGGGGLLGKQLGTRSCDTHL